ncbi:MULTISPECIES: DUF6950 family protein [unclassified Marinovum]|uniref:DUF6950 family protein n=1 Tax=unclassified Marinovum TaxID=2647166 RepID=UPI003EDBD2D6
MIPAFLTETRAEPFAWGRTDCAIWCADLVFRATGHDPATDLRGTYDTRFGYLQILKREGGLLQVVGRRMDRVPGLSPLDGDNGVAVAKQDGRAICGVVLDGALITRTARGCRIARPDEYEILRGWTCPRL